MGLRPTVPGRRPPGSVDSVHRLGSVAHILTAARADSAFLAGSIPLHRERAGPDQFEPEARKQSRGCERGFDPQSSQMDSSVIGVNLRHLRMT